MGRPCAPDDEDDRDDTAGADESDVTVNGSAAAAMYQMCEGREEDDEEPLWEWPWPLLERA